MERAEAIASLSPPYQRLFDLLEQDLDEARIASELGIERAGLPSLIELAHAKLAVHLVARRARPEAPLARSTDHPTAAGRGVIAGLDATTTPGGAP